LFADLLGNLVGRIDLEGVVGLAARAWRWLLPRSLVLDAGAGLAREREPRQGPRREPQAADRHEQRERRARTLAPAPRPWIHPVLSAPSRAHPRLACRPLRR